MRRDQRRKRELDGVYLFVERAWSCIGWITCFVLFSFQGLSYRFSFRPRVLLPLAHVCVLVLLSVKVHTVDMHRYIGALYDFVKVWVRFS